MQHQASTLEIVNQHQALAQRYLSVRRLTEKVCAPLSPEDQMVQSMPDASPVKWHQAHTTWFFETFILLPRAPDYRPFDERYTYLFNSYYKSLRSGHPIRAQRGLWSRPSLHEVAEYRRHVDEHMLQFIEHYAPSADAEFVFLLELGLHHEQQHQELIVTDIKHALWSNPLRPPYQESKRPVMPEDHDSLEAVLAPPLPATGPTFATAAMETAIVKPAWTDYPGGLYAVGYTGDGFTFDNEAPRHEVFLRPFSLACRLVTNAEYLQFMNEDGYTRPELWLSEGWDTVNAQHWRAPLYWQERERNWVVYTLCGELPIDPAEPVCHVSYFEADAYARWAGARLATEFEWEVAASKAARDFSDAILSGNYLDSGRLQPASAALSGRHPIQLFGDVWEWTASQYLPYPGFHPAPGAVGEYNGKFMCNQFVLRGGSCATPAGHIRPSYRNFFPPQARWQFSGIRLAHD